MSALHPELVLAKRNIALANDKLHALEREALRLSVFLMPLPDRVDALMDAARANGLFDQFRRDDIEHVIGQGLRGIATLPWNSNGGSNNSPGDERHWQGPHSKDALVTVRAIDIKPKRVEWFWPNRFARGKVGVLGGHPDEGKSLILADMAARATRGDSWPCNEGRAPIGNAIILTAEDDLDDTVIPRLMAAGADLERIYIIKMVKRAVGGSRMFSLLTDLELLERKIAEIGNIVSVGIDPLTAYFGVGKIDAYRTTDVRGVMTPLAAVAQKQNLTIVGVLHFNKNVNVTNAMFRFSDSLAFVAAARHAFVVTKDPENEGRRLFLKAKNNLAADGRGLAYSVQAIRRAAPGKRSGVHELGRTHRRACDRRGNSDRLLCPRVRRPRRPHELWHAHCRRLSSSRHLRRSNSQGYQAGRSPSAAAH
jgi:hypothetical protein